MPAYSALDLASTSVIILQYHEGNLPGTKLLNRIIHRPGISLIHSPYPIQNILSIFSFSSGHVQLTSVAKSRQHITKLIAAYIAPQHIYSTFNLSIS